MHPETAAMEVGRRDKFSERSAAHQGTNMTDPRVFPHPNYSNWMNVPGLAPAAWSS